MATIDSIVKVQITRETNFPTVQDLSTMLILTKDALLDSDNLTKIYTSVDEVVDDGYDIDSFVYKATSLAFSQDIRPSKVIVGLRNESESTVVNDLTDVMEENNQWLYLITDVTGETAIKNIAQYIETTKKFYVFARGGEGEGDTIGLFEDLADLGYDNTFYMYYSKAWNMQLGDGEIQTNGIPAEAGWVAYFGSQQAGSTIWIYKPIDGLVADNISSNRASQLNAANANYYSTINDTAVMLGNNTVAGGEYIDVMVGVRWLETRLPEKIWGTMLNTAKLNYNSGGIAKIESDVRSVIAEAIRYNILDAQPAPVVTLPNALDKTPAERNTRNLTGVAFRAKLAGAIQYIDGINGTVYP